MIHKLHIIFLLGLCLSLMACNEDNDNIDPGSSVPVIKFPLEQLDVDLNKVDNLPVIAVIKSQAGLQNVTMKIQTADGITEYKTVDSFFNLNSYSLSESLEYTRDFEAFIVEATDRLNRVVADTLPISVTDVVELPVITFEPEEVIYDEMDEDASIPRTTFKVVSEAGLKSVEMYLVSSSGQETIATAILSDGEKEYTFDEMINYKEGDKGFKVKAEDTYGYITIATMPVTYRTVPLPSLTITEPVISVSTGESKEIPMRIESTRGLQEIVIYRVEGETEVEILREKRSGEHTLDYDPKIDSFTEATSGLKVVVSDGRSGKEVTGSVKTYVDMEVVTLNVGSQIFANTACEKYPDAYGMVSLNDMKTYSVDYAIASEENAKNIDFKFYCYGASSVPRLYSMDNGEKNSEFSGTTGKLSAIKAKTMARFALLSNFDYENATVASISANILSSSISQSRLAPIAIGDIIAFRTGSTSAAGGGRIGVMKVVSMTEPKELLSSNVLARVMTVEIKFPKKK